VTSLPARSGSPVAEQVRADPMDPFDRDLITFVIRWAPYGGPPHDEVLPTFGISADGLGERVLAIVRCYWMRNLAAEDRSLLLGAAALLRSRSVITDPGIAEHQQPKQHGEVKTGPQTRMVEQDPERGNLASSTHWPVITEEHVPTARVGAALPRSKAG
jgi:hypothetical protein